MASNTGASGEDGGRDDDAERRWTGEDPPAGVALLHETEHALEWLHRARGHLLAFHHAVGHAMDKLADAEEGLRAAGHDDLADRLRDEMLPAGVTGTGAWSYEVVEAFEDGPLADAEAFEADARHRLTGGERHVLERDQQERWRERSREHGSE